MRNLWANQIISRVRKWFTRVRCLVTTINVNIILCNRYIPDVSCIFLCCPLPVWRISRFAMDLPGVHSIEPMTQVNSPWKVQLSLAFSACLTHYLNKWRSLVVILLCFSLMWINAFIIPESMQKLCILYREKAKKSSERLYSLKTARKIASWKFRPVYRMRKTRS